jgi:hypothetical protein
MKTNLNRRLEALEGNLPAPQETEKARVHAQARMIVEEQEACDLVNQFFELVATNAPDEAIKPVALALLDRMDALESARVQG